jgi:tRNA-dihydrouridine synthase B
MITVHGRTRQQYYKGTARWHLVRPVVEAVGVPVVVNGDIADAATAREALAQSGAAAVMIGRGAQGQPWRVGQVADALAGRPARPAPEGEALAALVAAHYEEMLTEYGREVGVRAARKHLDWYLDANGIVLDKPARTAFLGSDDPAQVLAIIAEHFAPERRLAA